MFAENEYFQMWSDNAVKTSFAGTNIDVKPIGTSHLRLLKHGDRFTYMKNNLSV